jgi:hypothetical protein
MSLVILTASHLQDEEREYRMIFGGYAGGIT